jgi:hypothetical protein
MKLSERRVVFPTPWKDDSATARPSTSFPSIPFPAPYTSCSSMTLNIDIIQRHA